MLLVLNNLLLEEDKYTAFRKEWGWYLLQELNDLLVKGVLPQSNSDG